ncbi:MAG: hypothetical protein EP329_14065 [Deltaproteobacteria bacterium]|nr:MAG: hypothetical protein EP329_14065 [Deltaproteobacteria bacterium]
MGGQIAIERDDGLDGIHEILAPVLGDRARARASVAPAAELSPAAEARVEAVDKLVALFVRRLEAFAPPRPLLPAPIQRRAPVEMPEPPELPSARAEVDLDDLHLQEMPPLPEGIDLEPPPIPTVQRQRPKPRSTGTLEALPADSTTARLLYEDILWLVSINDWKAAMVSIERILVGVRFEGALREFFEFNEVKLLNLFESFLGKFVRIPRRKARTIENAMPDGYERTEKIQAILELVDGERAMQEILRESPYTPLETCSALNQARRCGVIEILNPDADE